MKKPYPKNRKKRTYPPLLDRFFSKVEKSDTCWNWEGSLGSQGYGSFARTSFNGGKTKEGRAHRISWILHNGPIPEGMCVCHMCDNIRCVRPEHLFLGTLFDNQQDCVQKKRHAMVKKTHCPSGHEYIGENVFITWRGGRGCKKCRDVRNAYYNPRQNKEKINERRRARRRAEKEVKWSVVD